MDIDSKVIVRAPLKIVHCRSCLAEIVWANSERGNRMPIDAHPVAGGNLRVIRHPIPTVLVVGPTIDLFDPDDDGTRYVAHFTTCPDADEHRTPRRK